MRAKVWAGVLSAALLSAPGAMAQTINTPLQVRTGDVYTVAVEQTQTTEFGEQDIEATLSHTYALHIVDAENGVWRYVPASMSYSLPTGLGIEAQAAALDWPVINEAVSAVVRLSTDIGFECRVDAQGRCQEVTNWPAWRDRAENIVIMSDAIARMVPRGAATPEEPAATVQPTSGVKGEPGGGMTEAERPAMDWATLRAPVLRGIASMLDNFDSRDAATWLASIQGSTLLQGRALTRREAVQVSDELEMPFGAPPLRFTGTMRLERVNQRDNTATIVRRVTLDEASARASIQGMSRFLTTNLVQPVAEVSGEGGSASAVAEMIDPILNAIALQYEETTTGIIDLNSGLARETTTNYIFTMAPPGGEGTETPMSVEGRTVIRVSPGAPPIQRLPRS